MSNGPLFLTFDIFGTVLDWRSGLGLSDDLFERVVDRQAALEQGRFRSYAEIVAQSLVDAAGMNAVAAAATGANAGRWPLFADSREALQRLRKVAPCVAMTNSDSEHGAQVRGQLAGSGAAEPPDGSGSPLDGWVCAEDVRLYKPDPAFWRAVAERHRFEPGPRWWHVSAYADYDLRTARSLGLTTVFVRRPHSRAGSADLEVRDLAELAERLSGGAPGDPG
jgi:2-haloalkanoic acid dehalogenase type II